MIPTLLVFPKALKPWLFPQAFGPRRLGKPSGDVAFCLGGCLTRVLWLVGVLIFICCPESFLSVGCLYESFK